MKKVSVMIVDTKTGVSQFGVIEEPVKEGYEIDNALKHFGVERGHVIFEESLWENILYGFVEGTTKYVNIVVV